LLIYRKVGKKMDYTGMMRFALDLGKLGSVSGDNKIAGLAAVAAVGIGAIGYGASSLKHRAKAKKAAKKESEAVKAEEQKAAEHLDDDDVEIVVEDEAADVVEETTDNQEQCDAATEHAAETIKAVKEAESSANAVIDRLKAELEAAEKLINDMKQQQNQQKKVQEEKKPVNQPEQVKSKPAPVAQKPEPVKQQKQEPVKKQEKKPEPVKAEQKQEVAKPAVQQTVPIDNTRPQQVVAAAAPINTQGPVPVAVPANNQGPIPAAPTAAPNGLNLPPFINNPYTGFYNQFTPYGRYAGGPGPIYR
jgi:FtsZ-interacting cell division protein ZipA